MSVQKSIFWSLFSRGATYFFILIQGMIIARLIGPEGKGIQAKLLASVSFFVFFLDFGISNSINYFLSQRKITLELTKKILNLICIIQFILSGLILSGLMYAPLKNFFLPNEHTDLFLILYIVITVFCETTRLSLNSTLTALLKFKVLNWIEIFQSVLKLFCYLVLFFLYKQNSALFSILQIDLLSSLIVFIGLFVFIKTVTRSQNIASDSPQKNEPPQKMTLGLSTEILHYAFPLFLSNLVIYFNTRLDYIAIEKTMGLESLGYYATASSGAQILTIVPVIIGSVIFSYLNQIHKQQEKIDFFSFYSRLNFTLLLCISIFAIPLAPIIIPILFGPKFNTSIQLFQMLIVIALLQSYKYLLGIFLQSINKNKLRLQSDIAALILNIVFLYPILHQFQLQGAIGLLFLGQLISIVFIHINLHKFNISHSDFFLIRRTEIKKIFSIENITKLR